MTASNQPRARDVPGSMNTAMPEEGKRDRLARAIVKGCHWLSARSVKSRLLFEDIAARLLLSDAEGRYTHTLPVADPVYAPVELARRTDELNVAADRYFSGIDRDYLLGKPFTDRLFFARRLFDLGVLFHWLRIIPGDVVLELGAGSCWLSHLLNRYGCKTIAVDVSPTALAIGRELFETDAHTDWSIEPEFVASDGHRLPLDDGSVDKIIVYDAFHHVPNYGAVLAEMARVLGDGGIIGMREPGRHHAAAEKSQAEVREFGVLENDVIVEDIERLGRQCGLDRTTIVPLTIDDSVEVPASELGQFMRARNLRAVWEPLCTALVETNFILMYKGTPRLDTRRPGLLDARIRPVSQSDPLAVRAGQPSSLTVEVENAGDTLWLADTAGVPGWTQLGLRLHTADKAETLIDGEWQRARLPRDVPPGDSVRIVVELPALGSASVGAGNYIVVFDLVAEGVAWFADVNSPTARLGLRVVPADD
jgi:SAM-dependent methyltransferase